MRNNFIVGLLFTCVLLLGASSSYAKSKDELAEKYYDELQGADGTAAKIVVGDLINEVPLDERQEVCALILDRGMKEPTNTTAVSIILSGLGGKKSGRGWSKHLETAVIAYANSKDPDVRSLLPAILSKYDAQKYRNLCLSYLGDPDKSVRYHAVRAIRDWPDASKILTKFAEGRSSDPNDPVDPVEEARQIAHKK